MAVFWSKARSNVLRQGNDKLMPWRSLTLLPAYSSAKSENSLMVRNFVVCHLEICKLAF